MESTEKATRLQLTYLVTILEKKEQKARLPPGSKGILNFEGEMPLGEFDRQMKLLGGKNVSKST